VPTAPAGSGETRRHRSGRPPPPRLPAGVFQTTTLLRACHGQVQVASVRALGSADPISTDRLHMSSKDGPTPLVDVFGIRRDVNPRSYVNRGGLDERLSYLVGADRHVVLHGDSKQGKSWLRTRVLQSDDSIVVQCQLGTTPEQILRQALGVLNIQCEMKRKSSGAYEGSIEFSGSGELGVKILAKLGLGTKVAGKTVKGRETETQPVGQTPADLSWVSKVLVASEKRLVIEDFHYIAEESRRECAHLIKALGDFGVFAIIIGIWPTDHLLSYYNGDLEGRVEDLHLKWLNEELDSVLAIGSKELGVSMSANLRQALKGWSEYVICERKRLWRMRMQTWGFSNDWRKPCVVRSTCFSIETTLHSSPQGPVSTPQDGMSLTRCVDVMKSSRTILFVGCVAYRLGSKYTATFLKSLPRPTMRICSRDCWTQPY